MDEWFIVFDWSYLWIASLPFREQSQNQVLCSECGKVFNLQHLWCGCWRMLAQRGRCHQEKTPMWFLPPRTPLLYSKTGVCRGIRNFLISTLKHRLWVLVRIASLRRFKRVPIIDILNRNKKNIKLDHQIEISEFIYHPEHSIWKLTHKLSYNWHQSSHVSQVT